MDCSTAYGPIRGLPGVKAQVLWVTVPGVFCFQSEVGDWHPLLNVIRLRSRWCYTITHLPRVTF